MVIGIFIGCDDVNNKIDSNENESKINEEKKDFQGTLIVGNEEELSMALKENYSITI